jgi:hypothetical protein
MKPIIQGVVLAILFCVTWKGALGQTLPNREWVGYLGGEFTEFSDPVAVIGIDREENVYVSGMTTSVGNIATAGAHKTVKEGYNDVFLIKLDKQGNKLWGTYYGGEKEETVTGIHVSRDGTVHLCGYTRSVSGIATIGAHKPNFSGRGSEAFLAKFNAQGALIWATYHGEGETQAYDVKVDPNSGKVVIVGSTTSTANIGTPGAFYPQINGAYNMGFIAVYEANGSFAWGSYFGPQNASDGTFSHLQGVVVEGNHAHVYGGSIANLLISNAVNQVYNGRGNGVIAAFDINSGQLLAGLHGFPGDFTDGVYWEYDSSIFLSGYTVDNNMGLNVSEGMNRATQSHTQDLFVAKIIFDNGAYNMDWVRYYGGSGTEEWSRLTINPQTGTIFLTGATQSPDHIATPLSNIYQAQPETATSRNSFIASFTHRGNLNWATYYSGNWDVKTGGLIFSLASNSLYLVGDGLASNLSYNLGSSPLMSFNGNSDAFVAKFYVCSDALRMLIASMNEAVWDIGDQLRNEVLAFADGPLDELTWEAEGLPFDLRMDRRSGQVSGVILGPEAQGTIKIKVRDRCGIQLETEKPYRIKCPDRVVIPRVVIIQEEEKVKVGDRVDLEMVRNEGGPVERWTASGLPDGLSIDGATGRIVGQAQGPEGEYEVTVAALDRCGRMSEARVKIIVKDCKNKEPLIDASLWVGVDAGRDYEEVIKITDQRGNRSGWRVEGLPSGLAFDESSGVISGQTTQVGRYEVKVTAWNECGEVTRIVIMEVRACKEKPVKLIKESSEYALIQGDDFGPQKIVQAIKFPASMYGAVAKWEATGLPEGLEIDPGTGEIRGRVTAGAGVYEVEIVAIDKCGNRYTERVKMVVKECVDPRMEIETKVAGEIEVRIGEGSVVIRAFEVIQGVALNWVAEGLPEGLVMNPATGVITGLAGGREGRYTVRVEVTDRCGRKVIKEMVIIVKGCEAEAVKIVTKSGEWEMVQGEYFGPRLLAEEVQGQAVLWEAMGLPEGLSIDANSGLVKGEVKGGNGLYLVTIRVKDRCGRVSEIQVRVRVISCDHEMPPRLAYFNYGGAFDIEDRVEYLGVRGQNFGPQPLVRNVGGPAARWEAEGLPDGMRIDPNTGVISGRVDAPIGNYAVVIKAIDPCGRASSIRVDIRVIQTRR